MIEMNNFDQIEATFSQNLSNVLLQVLSDTMSRSFTRAGEMIAHNGPARFITVSYDLDMQRSINYHRQLQSNFNQVIACLTQQENTSASSMALGVLPVADIKDYKVNADSVIDRVSDLLLQTKQSSDHFLVDQLELKELTTH
jgi:GGDEF domain-containing protein